MNKGSFYLFGVASVCGLSLSFLFPFSFHGSDNDAKDVYVEPVAEYNLASRLVAIRDDALRRGDAEQLYALSVADSPARRQDEYLVSRVEDIEDIQTRIVQVDVLDDVTWRVYTQQMAVRIEGRDGSVSGIRCTVWHMRSSPWRIEDTEECE